MTTPENEPTTTTTAERFGKLRSQLIKQGFGEIEAFTLVRIAFESMLRDGTGFSVQKDPK